MKPRGLKGKDAELLFEKYLASEGWTYHRAAATGFVRLPSGKSFCKSHDLFGCLDFIAFKYDDLGHGSGGWDSGWRIWGVQVTTQGGRSERRKKLKAVGWPDNWTISIVSHERLPDPAHRGRTKHYWRIEDARCGDTKADAFDPVLAENYMRESKRQLKEMGK